jgi:hypothetical protein
MKPLLLCMMFACVFSFSFAQNVGVGETNPQAKLTIKASDAFSKALMVKNTNDDTTLLIWNRNHFINGYTNQSFSSMTIGNKYFLPFDNPQLTLMGYGERVGANASGSLGILEFRNANTNAKISFYGYLGAAVPHNLGLYYINPDDGTSKTYLYFTQAGNTGIGTFTPVGRLQIDHFAGASTPTLNLYDSSTLNGPIVQFRNSGGSRSWQIRTEINHPVPANDEFNIVNNNNTLLTVTGPGTLRVTGEVNRTSTGNSNLVPVAYGNISATGNINSGSGNFTLTKIAAGWYSITITGETYQFQTYTTVVTPAGNIGPVMTNTGSGGGNLHVYTYNGAGAAADSQFCFVVYRQ